MADGHGGTLDERMALGARDDNGGPDITVMLRTDGDGLWWVCTVARTATERTWWQLTPAFPTPEEAWEVAAPHMARLVAGGEWRAATGAPAPANV
jgi:hypothetical protein